MAEIKEGMRVEVTCDNDGGGGDEHMIGRQGTAVYEEDGFWEVRIDGEGPATFQFGEYQLEEIKSDEPAVAATQAIAASGASSKIIKTLPGGITISEPEISAVYLDAAELPDVLAKQAMEIISRMVGADSTEAFNGGSAQTEIEAAIRRTLELQRRWLLNTSEMMSRALHNIREHEEGESLPDDQAQMLAQRAVELAIENTTDLSVAIADAVGDAVAEVIANHG